MLKKVGIITAASTAALLAVSPLAFAGGDQDSAPAHGVQSYENRSHGNQNSDGLVNGLNGNNVDVPIQACNNHVPGQVGVVPVQDVGESPAVPVNGALGALGGEARSQQDTGVDNSRTCAQGTGDAGYGNR